MANGVIAVGTRVRVSGGYDYEPAWLSGREAVSGTVAKWIPGQNEEPACVIELDEPLTATGGVDGRLEQRTGRYLVLELRSVGQKWTSSGVVHVELCDAEPENKAWPNRSVGAWVESHATYSVAATASPMLR